jgi:hypothetical protein
MYYQTKKLLNSKGSKREKIFCRMGENIFELFIQQGMTIGQDVESTWVHQ